MGVCFVGKAEVSVAMRFVNCLLHGAQHHDLQQFGIGSAFELFGKCGIVFGVGLLPPPSCKPNKPSCSRRVASFSGVGPKWLRKRAVCLFLSGTLPRRRSPPTYTLQSVCGRHCGQRARFFDFAVVVEKHLGFDAFKLHRAAFEAFF